MAATKTATVEHQIALFVYVARGAEPRTILALHESPKSRQLKWRDGKNSDLAKENSRRGAPPVWRVTEGAPGLPVQLAKAVWVFEEMRQRRSVELHLPSQWIHTR